MPIDIPMPPAQTANQASPDAGAAPPPSGDAAGSPGAIDEAKRERDRRAQEGRELAELRRQNAQLAGQVTGLYDQLNKIGASLSEREKREQEAYLQSLPPDERADKRIELLEQRLDAATARTTQQQQPQDARVGQSRQETEQEARDRLSREILAEVNAQFGTDITLEDAADLGERGLIDWGGPDTFRSTLKTVAAMSTASRQATPPKEGVEGGGGNVANKQQGSSVSEDERTRIRREEEERIYRELGISRPNSARAASGRPAPPDPQEIRQATWDYNPRNPKAARQRIAKIRAGEG